MWELSNENELDKKIKEKICQFCRKPEFVLIRRTAERDMALIPITKAALLESVHCHVQHGRSVQADYMDNGDLAYILAECKAEQKPLYVKVKFGGQGSDERMYVVSAHPPRRW